MPHHPRSTLNRPGHGHHTVLPHETPHTKDILEQGRHNISQGMGSRDQALNPVCMQVAGKLGDVAFHEVDAHNVVPVWEASDKRETGARTIRGKIHRHLPEFLQVGPGQLCPLQAGTCPGFCRCGLASCAPRSLARGRGAVLGCSQRVCSSPPKAPAWPDAVPQPPQCPSRPTIINDEVNGWMDGWTDGRMGRWKHERMSDRARE